MKPSPLPTCRDPRPLTISERLVAAAARENRHRGPTRCLVPNLDQHILVSCDPTRFPDDDDPVAIPPVGTGSTPVPDFPAPASPVGTGSTPVPDFPTPVPDFSDLAPDPTDLLEDRSSAVGRVVAVVGAFLLLLLMSLLTLAAGLLRWLI